MNKVDRIMEVVCDLCKFANHGSCWDDGDIPECKMRGKISAILASPEVVVVEGVEWVPGAPVEYQHLDGDDLWTVTLSLRKGMNDGWKIEKNGERVSEWSDYASALSAATAAIKEVK